MILFKSSVEQMMNKGDIEGLIKALKDEDVSVRKLAVWALGDIRDTSAVEAIVGALNDLNVRRPAMEVLVKKGGAAVEPLIEALTDESQYAREAAAKALGKIGDVRAVEPLIEAQRGEEGIVKTAAVVALREIGDAKAVETFIRSLGDEGVNARVRAVTALGKVMDDLG